MTPDYSLVGEVPQIGPDYWDTKKGLGEPLLGPEFWVAVRCALREQNMWNRIPTWRTHIEGRARAADLGEMVLFLLHQIEGALNGRHLSPGRELLLEKGYLFDDRDEVFPTSLNATALEALLAANLGDIANGLAALAAPLPDESPHLVDATEAGEPMEAQEAAIPGAEPRSRGKRRKAGSAKAD